MSYEITEPGFVAVWQGGYCSAILYGPIEPDAIQDFIDSYPDDEFDDVIGYAASELAVQLGEMFARIDAPLTREGNMDFFVNDPALVGKEESGAVLYRLTMVPVTAEGDPA